MGNILRARLNDTKDRTDGKIATVRGKGLLNAIVVPPQGEKTAMDLCMDLKEKGLLAKPTHDNIIRFAPPLVINEEEINECADIIDQAVAEF